MLIVAATEAHNSFSSVRLRHAFYIFESNFQLQYGIVCENNRNRYVSTIIRLLIIHTRPIVVLKEIFHYSIRRHAEDDTENRFDGSNSYKAIRRSGLRHRGAVGKLQENNQAKCIDCAFQRQLT